MEQTNEQKPIESAEAPKNTPDQDVEANKTMAALSYVWILCLVPLLGKKNSKFAQFHAKQGLVLFAVEIVASILTWIPVLGWLLGLGLLIVAIMAIIKALNGDWWEIPYVYDWSKKINF